MFCEIRPAALKQWEKSGARFQYVQSNTHIYIYIYVQVCTHNINRYAYTTIVDSRYLMLFTSYDIKDTGYHIHMHTFISRYEIPVVSLSLSLFPSMYMRFVFTRETYGVGRGDRFKPLTQGTKHHRKHVKTYSFCPLLMYKEILCLTHIGVYTYCLHIVTIE